MSRYSSISLVINITILYRPSFCARSWCFICILWWKKRPRRIDPKVPHHLLSPPSWPRDLLWWHHCGVGWHHCGVSCLLLPLELWTQRFHFCQLNVACAAASGGSDHTTLVGWTAKSALTTVDEGRWWSLNMLECFSEGAPEALLGPPLPVWENFWVYVSRAFCLEKILYFLNFFNSFELFYLKMQEIIKIIRKIKKK